MEIIQGQSGWAGALIDNKKFGSVKPLDYNFIEFEVLSSPELPTAPVEKIYPTYYSTYGGYNLWNLEDYIGWANKINLKLMPCIKRVLKKDGTIAYLDTRGTPLIKDVRRERDAIKQYLTSQSQDYFQMLKRLQKEESVLDMDPNCRVAVLAPAYNEGRNVLKFLEAYSTQKSNVVSLLDPSLYEFNVILNRGKGMPEDTEAIQSILEFKEKNPNIKLNWVNVEFEDSYHYGERGVGLARKIMTDLILLRSISRESQSGPLYIETEDCDHHIIDNKTIYNVIRILDGYPHLDAVYGVQDRDPEILKQNDLIFMERRLWYFVESILQREKISIRGGNVSMRLPAKNWNFNWHRVVTGGWNCAYTAEAYALIKGYDAFRKIGEDMDIGQKISILRGIKSGNTIIPCVDTIGRTPSRISSSPRRFIYTMAKEEGSYQNFADDDLDRRLKSMSDDELLKLLNKYERLSFDNKDKFQAIISGLYGFLTSAMGGHSNTTEYIFRRAMFFLGFKQEDFKIKQVDYTDAAGERHTGWGIEILNIDNIKRYLDEYRTLHKDEKLKRREVDGIMSWVKKFDQEEPNVQLFWKRKEMLDKLKDLHRKVGDIKDLAIDHKDIADRLRLIGERSLIFDQDMHSINSLIAYLQDIEQKLATSHSGIEHETVGELRHTIGKYIQLLERNKDKII
jgi:hypothetical protein